MTCSFFLYPNNGYTKSGPFLAAYSFPDPVATGSARRSRASLVGGSIIRGELD
jgi:hypothetical protein